jgi:hypothetical protein
MTTLFCTKTIEERESTITILGIGQSISPNAGSTASSSGGGGGGSHYATAQTTQIVITTPIVSEPKPVVLPVGSVVRGSSQNNKPAQTLAVVGSAVSAVSTMQQPSSVADETVDKTEQKQEVQGLTKVTGMLVKVEKKSSWIGSIFASSNNPKGGYKNLGNGKIGSVVSKPTQSSWWDSIIAWFSRIV